MPVQRTPSKLRSGREHNRTTIDYTRRINQEPVDNPDDEKTNQSNNDENNKSELNNSHKQSNHDNEEVKLLKEQLAMIQERLEILQRKEIESVADSQTERINCSRNTGVPLNNITNPPQSESSLIQDSVINNNVFKTPKRATPKACKPEVFCGEAKENSSLWINSMHRFLKLTETPENLWVSTAVSYLKSNALLWWDAYLNSSIMEESEIPFEELKRLFLQRYQLVNATQSAHTRLVKWKQIGCVDT